jgi:RNA polymerase sigma-70 factor (ECF subfamily)
MAASVAPVVETHREQLLDPDVGLVALVREGDEAAFQLLYDRYFRRVYAFLNRRLGNRADVEETVQEVFFNVFSSIEGFRGEAPFAAWVFGITRRTLAARFKRKRHPIVPLPDGEAEGSEWASSDAESDPLANYEFREQLDRIDAVMREKLSVEQRTLITLHHLENRSIQEIAVVMQKSEDAVKSNLYRARKLLLTR